MAQRYGGRYSPDGSEKLPDAAPRRPFDGQRAARASGRSGLLFIAPLPLLVAAFTGPPVQLALTLAAFALLIAAAFMTREGLRAQEEYEARKIARRPGLPRKMLGSALVGAGLFLAGLADGSALNGIIFGVIGTALHFLAFGPDPLRSKGMEGIDTFQQDRVARAVGEAEKHLAAIRDAATRAQDRQIEARVERFITTAREMFRTVEEDPRDLTAARKYMGVYLIGARDATVRYADIWARTRDEQARRDYAALLDDLERNFTAQTQAFLRDDKADLDVEIEVLRERLAREGIAPQTTGQE